MNQWIMYLMAAGAVLGGIDYLFGNRKGYGKKFEEGFLFLGPTALSMAGIICLAPVLSHFLSVTMVPACRSLGFDPAMFGGLLAIDMGGYQLAKGLADNPVMGNFAGIVAAAIFGCTIVFTIPVGMGLVEKKDRTFFACGIMLGLVTMPVGLFVGGLLCGLTPGQTLYQMIPLVFLALILGIGLWKWQSVFIKGFIWFAAGIKILTILGLVAGAVSYMTGWQIIAQMAPLEEAMKVVSSIGIVMLGSLPLTEFIQRILRAPLRWIGAKLMLNPVSVAGLLISTVSVIPALTMIKDMDERGKKINAAFMVSATSMLAAHLGFTVSAQPDMLTALLASKAAGAGAALVTSLVLTQSQKR